MNQILCSRPPAFPENHNQPWTSNRFVQLSRAFRLQAYGSFMDQFCLDWVQLFFINAGCFRYRYNNIRNENEICYDSNVNLMYLMHNVDMFRQIISYFNRRYIYGANKRSSYAYAFNNILRADKHAGYQVRLFDDYAKYVLESCQLRKNRCYNLFTRWYFIPVVGF